MTEENFRFAETVMLTRDASAKAEKEWPFKVALVPLRFLTVDERYQRPRQEAFISKGAEQFDESLVGVLDVAARGERFAVLDGRQRLGMMEKVGKTAAWCAVYGEMTLRDEAEFFWKKNTDRKNMRPYYRFRARVVAQEPTAVRILSVIHGCGFDISPMTDDETLIGAIRALEDAYTYKSEYREESLTPSLLTIREAFFGRQQSTDGEIIRGLARFWQHFSDDEIEMIRLVESAGAMGPSAILVHARDRMYTSRGHSRGWQVARIVVEEYNKISRTGRVDAARLAE